jgi:acyl-CoA thioester hydrolase
MLLHESSVRVRYGETDRMGYAYYGNYPLYFEVARTDMIRSLGISYKEMEDRGIILPVYSLNVRYIAPAYYDELLTIKTCVKELPSVRIRFDYEVYNEAGTKIAEAETTLIFFDSIKKKPVQAPDFFLERISASF